MDFLELFPDAAYRHRMRFQSGTVSDFFGRTTDHELLLTQRRQWITRDAAACVCTSPKAGPLVDETMDLLVSECVLDPGLLTPGDTDPSGKMAALGCALEPDLLLLAQDVAGTFRLAAGSVCFSSSWSLAEKMGQPLEQIHDAVPGLNDHLGRAIQQYLSRLESGKVSLRGNWGLSRSAELNQHPSLRLPKLDESVNVRSLVARGASGAHPLTPEWWRPLWNPDRDLFAVGHAGEFRIATPISSRPGNHARRHGRLQRPDVRP